jgi:hypothetical protein
LLAADYLSRVERSKYAFAVRVESLFAHTWRPSAVDKQRTGEQTMSLKTLTRTLPVGSIIAMAALALPPLMISGVARADSISPSSYSATLAVGEVSTITKTVTISAGRPSSALVDVLFLTDTTGSMSPSIAGVRSQFAGIVTDLSALGNVAFGSAQYKDVGDSPLYQLTQNLTTNTSLVQTAINGYSATGGGDTPEAGLYSLDQAAGAGWRAGSTRFIVWTGDAPSHDKLFGVDETIALAALNAANIHVIGLNQPSGPGLNAASTGTQTGAVGDLPNASAGQATFITSGTGGQFFATATASDIENIVKTAITSSFNTYSQVCLDSSAAPAGVGVAHAPCITGSFDRSIDRTFNFLTSFTGLAGGTYDFGINAMVDGGIVATELDHIVVSSIPEPGTWGMLALGLGVVGFVARRRRLDD